MNNRTVIPLRAALLAALWACLGLFLSPSLVLAQQKTMPTAQKALPTGREVYRFDRDHTNILWYADHIGFSKSVGQFMAFEGEIILDHDQPEKSSVNIVIQTDSIMTGLPNFDTHLKSADFFDVEKYPEATFKSTGVKPISREYAEIEGDFTMLGETRPLTLRVNLNKRAMDIQKNVMRVGFSVKATLKRSEWGMDKYLPFIGDNVLIRIETEALMTQAGQVSQ